VLTVCWSVKGGVGSTVVSALLALGHARRSSEGALAIGLDDDLAMALGVSVRPTVGFAEWTCTEDAPPDALARLATEVGAGLHVIGAGAGELCLDRLASRSSELEMTTRPVIVDVGNASAPVVTRLTAAASSSLLVVRSCYLGLRRCQDLPAEPTGVVLVREPGRSLTCRDVEAVIGVPVLVEIDVDPAVARLVDAGLLTTRLPRSLSRTIEAVVG
jgi:hypothetical protein